MIKTIKVMLCPNNKQKTKLFACAGAARFAYNWALSYERKNYGLGNKFISDYDLRKIFTVIKSEEEYKWLNDYNSNIPKQAIKDAVKAYQSFLKTLQNFRNSRAEKNLNQVFTLIQLKSALLLLM